MRQRSLANLQLNTKLDRIEQRSRKIPHATFNNLGHALDLDLLRTCFHSLDARKAVGVDGVTKEQYGKKLESNLQELLLKIRNGSYYPKPSRIVEIPNEVGSPQGSILSPLLANIYLHYVLDEWFVEVNKELFRGTAHMVRYADDVLFTLNSKEDALNFHRIFFSI